MTLTSDLWPWKPFSNAHSHGEYFGQLSVKFFHEVQRYHAKYVLMDGQRPDGRLKNIMHVVGEGAVKIKLENVTIAKHCNNRKAAWYVVPVVLAIDICKITLHSDCGNLLWHSLWYGYYPEEFKECEVVLAIFIPRFVIEWFHSEQDSTFS